MNATLSSRAAAISKAASSTRQRPPPSTLEAVKVGHVISTRSKHPAGATPITKPRKAPSQSSNVSVSQPSRQPARPPLDESAGTRSPSVLELDVASQLYPWLFMRHTLTESSNAAAAKAQAVLAARAKELDAEEDALADDRIRYQAEKETQLIDELSHERIRRAAPSLIRKFVQSQSKCQDAIFHTVRVTGSRHNWNITTARIHLGDLEQFVEESTILREAITELACDVAPDSLLAPTLEGLLRLLDVRLENLQLSRELLTRMRDNFMTACHLESLSIRDL